MSTAQHPARVVVTLAAALLVNACNSGSSTGKIPVVAPPALTSIQFNARKDVTVGVVATAVASADIDGDDVDDLVVTRYQESKVTYLRSQGNGNYAPGIDLPIGPLFPLNLTIADLDGDGNKDVVVCDFVSNLIYTYRNTGGSFAAPTSFLTGAAPLSVAVADIDGDGVVDILAAATVDREIVVHRGLGALTYEAGLGFGLNGYPATVITGDFNGDSRIDVAVSDIATASLWFFKNEASLPNPPGFELTEWVIGAAGPVPVGLVAGNLDSDPDLEFVTSSAHSNELLVWQFDGTDLTPVVLVTGPAPTLGIALADFDGDGNLDLTGAHTGTSGVSAWRGLGSLQFSAPVTRATGIEPVFVAASDTSGDGRADVNVGASGSGEVSFFQGQVAGPGIDLISGPPAILGADQPLILTSGDLNGDGRPDILVADNASNKVSIFRNDGSLRFTKMGSLTIVLGANYQPLMFDLDKDGDLDVASLHGGGATIFRNVGNFAFVEVETIPVAGGLLLGVAGDLFQNGRDEFAATNVGSNRVSIFKNLGGNLDVLYNVATGTAPSGIDMSDVDNDGDLDIVNANLGSDTVTITKRVGGTFQPNALNLGTESEPVYVRATDVNDDGLKDIVVSHRVGMDVLQFRATGKLEYAAPLLTQANGSPFGMVVEDVDRNGVDDLIYMESQTGRAVVRLTQADGSFGVPVTNFASQYSVTTPLYIDLDGDTLPEILTGSMFSSLIQIHKNLSQ